IQPAARRVMPGVKVVRRFIEKPTASSARRMASSGRFLWNSGIFIWRASVILDELRRHGSSVIRPIEGWVGRTGFASRTVPSGVLRRVPSISIDNAVLERSSGAVVVKAQFRWSDLGNWDALGRLLARPGRSNTAIGRLVAEDSSGCLSVNERGLTVIV